MVHLFWETGDRPEILKQKLEFDPESIIVLEHNNAIIGVVTTVYDPWASFIWHLSIHPRYQSRGLGHMLADEAERRLKLRGTTSINGFIAHTNNHSRIFFQRRGFTEYTDQLISVEKPL